MPVYDSALGAGFNKRNLSLTVPEAEKSKSRCSPIWFLVTFFLVCRLLLSCVSSLTGLARREMISLCLFLEEH